MLFTFILFRPNWLTGDKLKDIELIPFELINSKRGSIRRAGESFHIDKAKTMQPRGINREDDY